MPKILVDNSKAKKQYKTYAVKTCPVCGSVIEVSEQEAISFPTLENNTFECECPCGNRLVFYKYFSGKKYSSDDYVKCVDYFYKDVETMLWNDVRYIPVGYKKEYIDLNHTEIISTPVKVTLNIYINKYDDGNWNNCVAHNVFFKRYRFNLLKLSDDLSACARYSQALSDYIIGAMNTVYLQQKGDINLNLKNIDDKELISYFRNGDTKMTECEIGKLLVETYETMNVIRENNTTQWLPLHS